MRSSMSSVVVDASLAVKWVIAESDSPLARRQLREWWHEGVRPIAPPLFLYEVTNVLHRWARVAGTPLSFRRDRVLALVAVVELRSLELGDSRRALELADLLSLPAAYDAHYLALAEREGCDMWTADARLHAGAATLFPWVELIGVS
jgi:predicted nucleic acid-binding protein